MAWTCIALFVLVAQPLPSSAASDALASPLKVSVAVGPVLPLGHAAERWTQLLNESGHARLAAKLHPGGALFERDAARELAALKDGRVDAAVGSTLPWSLSIPALGVFSLPWLAPDARALGALTASAALREMLASRLEAQGVVLVALAPLGHREVATVGRAIRSPGDVQGLRLRASPSPLLHDALSALGALPQAMPFTQAQAALSSGALDGQEGPPSALAAARVAVGGQRHLTLWGAIGEAMLFAVRKSLWEQWSEAERESVRRAAHQAIAETDAPAREDAAVRKLAQNGIAVVRITSAGHDAFRSGVREASARWRNAIGDDVVSLAEETLVQTPRPAAKAP